MARALQLHDDRLFAAEPATRGVAQRLCREVADLPIISPHGHCPLLDRFGNERVDLAYRLPRQAYKL